MPEPELRDHDVLVQIHATGVNLLHSGNDVAGVVFRIGSRVQRFKARVFPFEATEEALAYVEKGRAKGKVVVKIRYKLGLKSLPLAGPTMKLAGPLAARAPWLRLALCHKVERHRGADEILQGGLVDLVAFVNVDSAPDIAVEAGVE